MDIHAVVNAGINGFAQLLALSPMLNALYWLTIIVNAPCDLTERAGGVGNQQKV